MSGYRHRTVHGIALGALALSLAWLPAGADAQTVYSVTQYSYDSGGHLQCTAVRMNPATFASEPASACTQGTAGSQGPDRISQDTYNTLGQLVSVQRGMGTPQQETYETYTYTNNGKPKTVADANGNLTTYVYDGFDRQVAWQFPSATTAGQSATCSLGTIAPYALPWPDGTTTTATGPSTDTPASGDNCEKYSYDANGNRVKLVKRDGSVLTNELDAAARVIVKVVPSRTGVPATDTRSVFYAYDLAGRPLQAWFDSATSGQGITNTYDSLGRLATTATAMDGATRRISYCYDVTGNRTLMSYPDSAVGSCPTGSAAPTGWTNYVRYAYDALNRPTTITTSAGTTPASYTYNPNGTRAGYGSNGSAVATSYSYDAIERPIGLSNTPVNTGYGDTFGFSYSPAGQIAQLTKSNNAFVYTGTQNDTRAYVANGLNQYATVKGIAFGYDANGNLTSDGAGTTYLYDVENRMVAATNPGTKLVGATIRYDPLGRLYEVIDIYNGGAITRFMYGGDELLAEYDSGGNMLRRYIHGADLKSDDSIAWYEGASFTSTSERLLRPNWQGGIELATDTTGASIYAANTYDEYGMPGSANAGRFQYTGQAWLREAKLYYYKARMYSPILGRFMQTDPIGYKDDVDLYTYVANDPVDRVDYSGQYNCSEGAEKLCDMIDKDMKFLKDLESEMSKNDKAQTERVLGAIGARGVDTGITANISNKFGSNNSGTTGYLGYSDGHIHITVSGSNVGSFGPDRFGHEVVHAYDEHVLGHDFTTKQQAWNSERRAYAFQGDIEKTGHIDDPGSFAWREAWRVTADPSERMRRGAIDGANASYYASFESGLLGHNPWEW